MNQSIQIQFCALIFLLLICYYSFKKQSVILESMWIYRQLVLVTTLCVLSDICSVDAIIYAQPSEASIFCRVYLFFVIWTSYLSFNYVCYDIVNLRNKKRLRHIFFLITLILSVIPFMLPISIMNEKNEVYSYGPAVSYTFIVAPIYIIGCIVMILFFNKLMNPYRSQAAMLWMILETTGAMIQLFNRELLLVSFSMALGITILFAKMENPDSGLDRNLGIYRIQMLYEYLKQLFYSKKHDCSFIIITGEDTEKSISSENLLLEISNYLKKQTSDKVFRGIGNDLVVAFSDDGTSDRQLIQIKKRFEAGWSGNQFPHPHFISIPSLKPFHNVSEFFTAYRYYSNIVSDSHEDFFVIDNDAINNMEKFRSMQNEIKAALKDDRLEIFLQPIYSVKEHKFVSAEALVRMRSDDGSIIMPNRFIPIAESLGQIEQIGERVFELVCKLIHDHDIDSIGLQYIEINLSVVQCENTELAAKFLKIMHKYGIDAKKINLEITESGAIKQKDILLENMEYLRKFGCTFSLDDFGTGESNLNYIVNMPVDLVKFDRTMVNAYFNNEKAKIMLESVTEMIKRMGMHIVAEGVEEKHQLEQLSKLGIDFIQGYYFSKPIPVSEFLDFVRRNNSSTSKL
ncbi:EAL domain, c-di-GMP-specific phosphodiesterase class I (or its enzymatically inactive variant) [Ruminococcus flavefaciens]|uniref:EAL domain, c-di-GMP-specific phosphodiesterase class I (Or its enzymatically inactive variant) n=2 Tax=Ruminococcus flavefaciens TaxID=1265 RepID=A0A1M7JAB2_RUMFL|nr:EAL domain, c-di-GMP-specific phosphodiesterase class I (or its enzymatically inactive variant) [Ruminococcus flavefaciens]